MRKKIRNTITHIPNRADLDSDYLKTVIREQISSFIYNKTKRRPMILPVIIEV
ncbi:MAG: hypothetical protein WC842_01605 [Candidatus Paceibacterota bacterium]